MKFHIYRELTKYKNYNVYQISGEIWWDQRAIAIYRPPISPLYEKKYKVIILLKYWIIFHVRENYYFAFDFYAYVSGWRLFRTTFFWSELHLTQIRSSEVQIQSTQFLCQVLLLIELTITCILSLTLDSRANVNFNNWCLFHLTYSSIGFKKFKIDNKFHTYMR